MILNFTQGVVSYPTSGGVQTFLQKVGQYVTLNATNGTTTAAFAHGGVNYLLTEDRTVVSAWGPLAPNVTYWLFWNINTQSGIRTFGSTTIEPVYGTIPPFGVEGLHWFDTTNQVMYVYEGGGYRERIRVFAGTVINSTFAGMGVGYPSTPFAGTQVGISASNTSVGYVLYDDDGLPIRRRSGQFFTSEDQMFINGASVTALRLESAILTGMAVENIAKYQVVKFVEFGKIGTATYGDIQTSAIAIAIEDLNWDDTGAVAIQGVITNPNWNWSVVGAPLWVNAVGLLTPQDPHVYDPLNNPIQKPAIARVISPNTIYFDQGLGGRGDKGEPGDASSVYASPTVSGVTRLSVPAVDVGIPIAVGDNDPRLTQALLRTGGTMTGTLTLNANPTLNLHAATKQYVDSTVASGVGSIDLTGLVARAGSTMTGTLTLNANPTLNLHAATKQYVDSTAATEAASAVSIAVAALTAPYDISMMIGGMMQDQNEIVAGALSVRPVRLIAGAGHAARAIVAPAGLSEYTLNTVVAGVETIIGSITFQPGSLAGIVSIPTNTTVAAGTMVIIRVTTAVPDATIRDVLVTLVGCADLEQC